MRLPHIVLTVALALLMGLAGAFIGRGVTQPNAAPESALHKVLHQDIKLDPDQRAKLDALNKEFAAQKATLEARLKADDAALAEAIAAEHGYGPRVAQAVEQTHHTMSDLQKLTLEHVFAMRTLLRPDQIAIYDAAVQRALIPPES